MASSLMTETDLLFKLSCVGYDMDDLKAKMNQCRGRISRRIMTMRLEAMRLEYNNLNDDYKMGNYIPDETDYRQLYDVEMSKGNEAISACSDY
jgi:hypothetical protein